MFAVLKSTLFSLFIFFSFFVYAHAQSVPGISDPITFSMIPTYPNPGEVVTLKAQSFSTDLNKATFLWFVNGKLHSQGVGLKTINISSGKAGAFTVIKVQAKTPDFGTIENTFSFQPSEVVLLWEADTYTPPFYQSKALHSYNGAFKVTAIPEFFSIGGKRINPKDLIYTWKKNGEVQGNSSGFGKDTYIGSQTSYLRDGEEISVEVSSPKESIAGTASLTLRPTVPEIVFYENSPLYGIIYEKALGSTYRLTGEEVTLRAEPFNMSTNDPLAGLLTFSWNMNGVTIPSLNNKNETTFRKTENTSGESSVGLIIQHTKKVLQGGQASVTILQ